jgi:DNA invertase Pin-like site-specific DNA recombinase
MVGTENGRLASGGIEQRIGRKKNVDDAEIRKRVAAGASKAAVARDLRVSRMTIYRALEGQGTPSDEVTSSLSVL